MRLGLRAMETAILTETIDNRRFASAGPGAA